MTKVPCKELAVTSAYSRIARQFRHGFIARGFVVLGLSCALSLPFAPIASAESFEDGVASYLAGDWKKAREIWQPIADDGDPVALFNIGVLFYQGLGVPADTTKAVEMYRTAAQHGYAPAQFNLGAAYRNGVGVPQSDAEAANWWQLAADQGEIQAQYNLGMLYAKGLGVAKDENTARYFFEQAARRGDQRAEQAVAALARGTAPTAVASIAKKVKTNALDDDTVAPVESTQSEMTSAMPTETTTVVEAPAPEPVVVVSAPAPEPEPVVVTAPAPEPAAPAAVVMSPSVDGQGASWALNNAPTAYTIQIYASGDENAAQKFIDRHNLGGMAHVVPAVSGSKLWFKVIYGSFGSTADAKNARSQLPIAIQKNSPWIRKFSAVQTELAPDASASTAVVSAPAPVPVVVPAPAPAPEVVVVTEADPNAVVQESTTIIVGDVAGTIAANVEETATTIIQPATQAVTQATTQVATQVQAEATAPTSVIQPIVEQQPVQPETVEPTVQLAENAPQPVVQTASTTQVQVAQPTTKLANNDSANPALAFSEGQRAFNQQDYASALQHWLPLAESGHSESQYGLGFMHETGWGVSRDASQAMGWYKRAAEQGYAKAQYNLGMMYLLGNGVPEDEAMGLYWIQSAADQNDLRARAQLSRLRTSSGS